MALLFSPGRSRPHATDRRPAPLAMEDERRAGLHLTLEPYSAPPWCRGRLAPAPPARVRLANLPTPLHAWHVPELAALGLRCLVKRDDASGFDTSGNKCRKLEFLLAKAQAEGATAVVTVGGVQSNHCRATAVAARQLGLTPHLVLRTDGATSSDPGMLGNLGYERMVGAHVQLVTKEEYKRVGSAALVTHVAEALSARGERPFCVPVGGSNALGTWGYIEMVRELEDQLAACGVPFPDHIVMACGSGGTTAGVALAVRLTGRPVTVTAIGVCDSPEYFYGHIRSIAVDMGADLASLGPVESCLRVHDGQGLGYAQSTREELRFIAGVAESTGVVLDPVYSGKALFHFVKVAQADPGLYRRGQSVVFIHTGGGMALSARAEELRAAGAVPGSAKPMHASML